MWDTPQPCCWSCFPSQRRRGWSPPGGAGTAPWASHGAFCWPREYLHKCWRRDLLNQRTHKTCCHSLLSLRRSGYKSTCVVDFYVLSLLKLQAVKQNVITNETCVSIRGARDHGIRWASKRGRLLLKKYSEGKNGLQIESISNARLSYVHLEIFPEPHGFMREFIIPAP